MSDRKFLNQTQPQTLVIATLLLYLNAFFNVLNGLSFSTLLLAVGIAMGVGAFGIANEKKWGYGLAVAGAILNVVFLLTFFSFGNLSGLISLVFDVALILLLLHPMSRDYQRIWFR